MEVIIRKDYDAMSVEAAKSIRALLEKKPECVIGLATGSSPVGLYKEMIKMHKEDGVDFSKVVTFNLDEYIGLPGDHPQGYRYFMNEELFDHINIDKKNTHVPDGLTKDGETHCAEYEQMIVDFAMDMHHKQYDAVTTKSLH